jgi:hypothetical protein
MSPRAASTASKCGSSEASATALPDAAALGEMHQVRLDVQPDAVAGLQRDASSMAQVEPLPLVPATTTTGSRSAGPAGRAPRAPAPASCRWSWGAVALAMGEPVSVASWSQVAGRHQESARAPQAPWRSGCRPSGHRVGALALQHGQHLAMVGAAGGGRRSCPARLASRNSARWKPSGSFLAHGVLDHPRAGKADQRLGLGDHHVAHEGKAGRHAAHGRVGQHADVGQLWPWPGASARHWSWPSAAGSAGLPACARRRWR